MSQLLELFVPIETVDEPLAPAVGRALGWAADDVGEIRILRRSLDARKKWKLGYRLRLEVARAGESLERPARSAPLAWPSGVPLPRVVIVGSGPTGSWAALRLAEAGVPSTILERGKPVQPRRRDLATLQRGVLDPQSNYCFGEGGAGTYSDGKLYTRSKNREAIAAVLGDLVRFGAPPDIEFESRPHVGSNRLPKVLTDLRTHLETLGTQYLFETDMTGLRIDNGRVRGVLVRGGGEVPADVVILAVGHSARSVYEWAHAKGVPIERKPFAVGVRIEHPQPVINALQYGACAEDPRLPPAFYEMTSSGAGRGVYSFCMCPGGWIVPAATEPDGVVVNGMSLSKRDSPFANSGMVVGIQTQDFGSDAQGPLAGVVFQRAIEQAAFRLGEGAFRAPAQRLNDFLAGRGSDSLPATSYRPGIVSRPMDDVFPAFVTTALREGLAALVTRFPAFRHENAVLVAAETRTSAPVRLLRDPATLQSPTIAGLYPAGEGAGYAGGIVSAAMDGDKIATAIVGSAR